MPVRRTPIAVDAPPSAHGIRKTADPSTPAAAIAMPTRAAKSSSRLA